jgi:alkylresorcinol/alkylpyrone synthase
VLSSDLPRAVLRRLPAALDAFLARHGVARDAIAWWVVHPGGPRVLEAVGSALHLPEGALAASWNVWTRYGNISSATALFILRELPATAAPPPGSLGVVMAFGPGLTCELALLEADGWLCRAS